MMKMLKRLWAFATGGRLVWLRDHDGEVTLTVAQKDPWGDWYAKRWWPWSNLGYVQLLPNGKTRGATYVEDWKDV